MDVKESTINHNLGWINYDSYVVFNSCFVRYFMYILKGKTYPKMLRVQKWKYEL